MKKIFRMGLIFLVLLTLTSCNLFKSKSNGSKKEELTFEALNGLRDFYKYTGEAITIENDVYFLNKDKRRSNGTLFNYTYENNVDPGVATAHITAKDDNELFKGSITITFNIVAADDQVEVTTYVELKAALTNPKHRFINIMNDITIPEGETLSIGKQIIVNVKTTPVEDYIRGAVLKNYGTINILEEGFLEVGGLSGMNSMFYNYGTINSVGNIFANSNGTIYNMGTINNTGFFKVYCALYSNSAINNVSKMNTNSIYAVRRSLTTNDLTFDSSIRFKENAELNKVNVHVGDTYISQNNIEYTGYDKVGTVSAVINFPDDDHNFYGSVSFEYTITKGEITVTTLEELNAKRSTGNFNEFTINSPSNTLTIDSDLNIQSGEIFNFNKSITISSNLTNNGAINMVGTNYNTINISGTNTLTNLGTIDLGTGNISTETATVINGSVTNNTASITGYLYIHNLTNFGNISLTSAYAYMRGNVINNGVIDSTGNLTFGSLINSGTINAGRSFTINENSTFTNESSGVITLSGESLFRGTSFINRGTINNNHKISILDSNETVTNAGTINNSQGEIYAFKSINGVTENIILREYLTGENTTLEFSSVTYNKIMHNPKSYIDGTEVSTMTGVNDKVRQKGTTTYLDKNPTDVGTYEKVINAYGSFNKYAGSITLEYTIDYATIHVSDKYNFTTAIGDVNYNLIILDIDIELSSSYTVTIASHQTLDLNGHTLTVSSSLKNRGKIIVRKVTELNTLNTIEEVSLLIGQANSRYTPLLDNYGVIENDGLIVVNAIEKSTAKMECSYNSSIINNGVIYTQENELVLDPLSTGTVYMRNLLTAKASNVTMSYTEIDYSGNENTPTIKVYKDSTELNISDYKVTYSNNINAGLAQVVVEPDSIFNVDYYGVVTRQFRINKAIKYLTSFDEELDGDNYYKFQLVNDIAVVNTAIIPANTILDLDIYRIGSIYRKISFGEGATLEVSVATLEDYNKFIGVASKIKLVANIGSNDSDITITIKNNSKKYEETQISSYMHDKEVYSNYVYIGTTKFEAFIDKTQYVAGSRVRTIARRWFMINGNAVNSYEGLTLLNTVVDLNGYNILSNIKFNLDKEGFDLSSSLIMGFSYINSGETESKIGYENNSKASFQISGTQDYRGTTTFSFNNVTVCGLYLGIPYLNGDVIINGDGANFSATTNPALYIDGDRNGKTQVNRHITTAFTSCTFRSTGNSAVVITSGTNSFGSCAIISNGAYSTGTSSNVYYSGCGVYVIQGNNASDRNIVVSLGNSTIASTNGYGIVERIVMTQATDYTDITYDQSLVTGGLGKYYPVRG